MNTLQILAGLVAGGFLVTLLVGLITGKVRWRQQGCCNADPGRDARMAAACPAGATSRQGPVPPTAPSGTGG